MTTTHALLGRAQRLPILSSLLHTLIVLVGAVLLTAVFFLVLPLIQAISESKKDMMVRPANTSALEPPPPPPAAEEEDEPEEEEEQEQELDLQDDLPSDLSQLELDFGAGGGSGFFGKDLSAALASLDGGLGEEESVFSLDQLDQPPRILDQPGPSSLSSAVRKRTPGRVTIAFLVNERGRVERPRVTQSTDAVLERPALAAVKKWRFEPAKRKGKPVSFRYRVPIKFPRM